jgi:photosystem II stability/assembly factor-like uncharacterized protein
MKMLLIPLLASLSATLPARAETPSWEWAGWGGGGYFFSAAFHPSKDGVLYMGGDVCGVYKSEDHGKHWRLVNSGLAGYAVYSLATDPTAADTVYAAAEEGLCKSIDGGASWRLLPRTGKKELRITGERDRSVRAVAVDPADGRIVYAASPGGKVYKSADGGESWSVAYEKAAEQDPPESLRVQFGKVNEGYHGGLWLPLACPTNAEAAACDGFGFTFKGDGTVPQNCFVTLKARDGAAYRSRELRELFTQTAWGDVTLAAKDFTLDPDYAKNNPEKARAYSGTPTWRELVRMDFCCVGPLMKDAPVGKFTRFYFAAGEQRLVAREFSKNKTVQAYGNIRVGSLQGNPVYSVAVAPKEPSLVLAATDDASLLLSRDAGKTWQAAPLPQKASSAAVAPSDPNVIYATFFKDGLRKSADKGKTWQDLSQGFPAGVSLREVAVSPASANDVYVIGSDGWNGRFFYSADGGKTWAAVSKITADLAANPTSPQDSAGIGGAGLSTPKNVTVNPLNPKELFIAANWRPCLSDDGGRTWTERSRGADISCVYDVRFHNGKAYACAMDEGTLVSADNGASWKQLWPLRYSPDIGGHNWRLSVSGSAGAERIVSTCSPWDASKPNRVISSADGGKSFSSSGAGLPAKDPHANAMWGRGYARALAADPKDPKTLYLGIDGDPSSDCPSGGGLFKSTDGGATWAQLAAQPGGRRVFFGLAVDPADSQRLYWACCGTGGGVWRSEDAGATWQHVFKGEAWPFNLHVAADGTVFCPGNNLWRSADRGKSWKKLTSFPFSERIIVAIETDPADSKRFWFATTTWGGENDGGVYETTDGGATWQEITSNLPYRKPLVLRYNADTRELWAAGVTLFKCKR